MADAEPFTIPLGTSGTLQWTKHKSVLATINVSKLLNTSRSILKKRDTRYYYATLNEII